MIRLARVPLPGGIAGGLLATGMPGTVAGVPVAAFPSELSAARVSLVVCLAPDDEILDRSPAYFAALLRGEVGVPVVRHPIPDWGLPEDTEAYLRLAGEVAGRLRQGETVLVHCAGGCGRTGTFCACVLVALGVTADEAVLSFEAARGCGPETAAQRAFVDEAAAALAQRPPGSVGTGR